MRTSRASFASIAMGAMLAMGTLPAHAVPTPTFSQPSAHPRACRGRRFICLQRGRRPRRRRGSPPLMITALVRDQGVAI